MANDQQKNVFSNDSKIFVTGIFNEKQKKKETIPFIMQRISVKKYFELCWKWLKIEKEIFGTQLLRLKFSVLAV